MLDKENKDTQRGKADSVKGILKTDNTEHKVELLLRHEGSQEYKEEEINIKDLIIKMLRGKNIIVFITLLAVVLSTFGSAFYILRQDYKGTASTIVSFSFEGVDKGLDPHGRTFDISELMNAQVLDKTIQDLELSEKGISVDGLKRNITISGIMPKDVMERVLIINRMAEKDASKLEQLNDLEYHPVEYKIDLVIPADFKIDSIEARQILDSITNNYKAYFLEKYSDRGALNTAVNAIDYKRYDYPEFVMLAESQLNVIKNYVRLKSDKSPEFRAKSTQMTFGDILSQINVLSDVDLNRIQALVNSFMLTKDADKLVAIYENSITKKQLDLVKKEEQARNLREQANSYKKDTSIMLMPGTAEASSLQINEASRTYDTLVESAASFTNDGAQLKADIAYYQQLIERLQNKVVTNTTDNSQQVEKYKNEVEVQVEELAKMMIAIVELTNETVDEYFETEVFKDAVKINVPANYVSSINTSLKQAVLMVGIATFLGLMIGILVALGKGLFKEENESNQIK